MSSPEHADGMLEPFRASGRDVDVSPVVMVSVDEDVAMARDRTRAWLAIYVGGMGAREKNFYVEAAERFGEGGSARRVQELFLAGDREGAAKALSDRLIDQSSICCRPSELHDRLAEYERAGATTLLALPFGDRRAIVRGLVSFYTR